MLPKEKLIKSKHFCMMPWIHFHVWPNGSVYPCCMADPADSFGNTHQQSIAGIWNSSKFKELRKNMVEDKASGACRRCYELEESADVFTLRKNSLKAFGHHFEELVTRTTAEGFVDQVKMAYMDIRFSNLCNFKCRSCGPIFSSAWQDEEDRAQNRNDKSIPLSLLSKQDFWSEFEPLLADVEEVYFAGGESLISPEHYKILDHWIQLGKTDVRLRYTTNFSHFRFKSQDLLEYWSKFSNVRVAASLDAEADRGEYLRKGTDWNVIVKNRIEMQARCPHVYFEVTPTVSVYNCFDLPDFHRSWIEKNLLEPANLRINYLLDPVSMRAQILPMHLKTKLKEKYENHIQFLKDLEESRRLDLSKTIHDFQAVVQFVFEQDLTHLRSDFFKLNDSLDIRRNEVFFNSFPELKEMHL